MQAERKRIPQKHMSWIMAAVMLVLCLFFVLIYFGFGNVYYDGGDDATLNLIAAGVYGEEQSAYLVFENIIFGNLLKGLYHLFPQVNVYLFLFLFLNLVSFFFISFAVFQGILKNHRNYLFSIACSLLTAILFNCLLGRDYYNSLQFTKVSGLYTATGFLLLWIWIRNGGKIRSLWWIPAGILLLFGFCIRKDSFLAVFGVIATALVIELFFYCKARIARRKTENKIKEPIVPIIKKYLLKNMVVIIIVSCLILLIIGVTVVNQIAYSTDEWKTALEYSRYRSELLDFGIPSYGDYPQSYANLGIDETDIKMLANWIYTDFDKFSLDTLKNIVALKKDVHTSLISTDVFFRTLQNLQEAVSGEFLPIAWLLLLPVAIYKRNSKLIWIYLAMTAGIFVEYYYFTYVGRVLWRLQVLPWTAAIVFFLGEVFWTKDENKKEIKRPISVAVLFMCAILIVCEFGVQYSYFTNRKNGTFFKSDGAINSTYRALHEIKDSFFLINAETIQTVDDIIHLDKRCESLYSNICFTGGWTIPSPHWKETLSQWGITNLIKSLVVNDGNYYYVDNSGHQELIRKYLEKEMGRTVSVENVDFINGYNIWQFTME